MGIITNVIFDLDGTLIDTESLVQTVSKMVVEKYGKTWTSENCSNRIGKRPIEASQSLIDEFSLPCTPEECRSLSLQYLQERWSETKALPGANRLIRHLNSNNIPIALASNSPRPNVTAKLSFHKELENAFQVIVCGDEIKEGKPSPEIFLKTSSLMDVDPSTCLVFEDSPLGVDAARRAGMRVIAIPSLTKKEQLSLYSNADIVLSSLYDFKPEKFGLGAFNDWIEEALPIDPWFIKGTVIKGFGRGSKMLGIPTANLPSESFSFQLAEQTCGIYLGWASLKDHGMHKMVTSVGWNPYFANTHKTLEPWILHEFEKDFYGEELRIIVVGYIRPESNFPSLESLIDRIHKDGEVAKRALNFLPFSSYSSHDFLKFN